MCPIRNSINHLKRFIPSLKLWKNLHSWIGLAFGLLLVMFGVTGVFMVNPNLFGLRGAPVHFAPVEWWYAKILPRLQPSREQRPGESELRQPDRQAEPSSVERESSPQNRRGGRRGGGPLTWGRVINDLHRGRIFGGAMNWFYTVGAAGFVFLALSGVWLWLKPFLIRRGKKKQPPALAKT